MIQGTSGSGGDLPIVADKHQLAEQPFSPYAVNQQTRRIWNEGNYGTLFDLTSRLRGHAYEIDHDPKNPASFRSFGIGEDGPEAFRVGGGIPPRIICRPSSLQRQNGTPTLPQVKAPFDPDLNFQLLSNWDKAWIYEDGEKETSCRSQPSAATANGSKIDIVIS